MTPNLDFKVTPVFDAAYVINGGLPLMTYSAVSLQERHIFGVISNDLERP